MIMRTCSCPVMVSTDVAVSTRVLFLAPIQSTTVISVCEVLRQGCTKIVRLSASDFHISLFVGLVCLFTLGTPLERFQGPI